ncbi:MAG TPA: hypothetical protein VEL28_05170 [Candidatus Binatia bacterium]|nr:hypothetical protein [Candidatus Binatia bacterium]
MAALLERRGLRLGFQLDAEFQEVLALVQKYRDVPMSIAHACLVTKIVPELILLTTDADFRVYRRHGRKVMPTRMP